jgi:hypothetical protein
VRIPFVQIGLGVHVYTGLLDLIETENVNFLSRAEKELRKRGKIFLSFLSYFNHYTTGAIC